MTKAVIYARVSSTSEADDKSTSIPNQTANCEALAERMGYEVVGTFYDKNLSGRAYPTGAAEAETDIPTINYLVNKKQSKQTRDGLAEALGVLRLGKASVLIVRDITRLYRPVGNSTFMVWIPNQLSAYNTTLMTCDGQTIPPAQAMAWLIPHMIGIVNDSEIKKRTLFSKEKINELIDSGLWISKAPYGWVRKKKHTYKVDKSVAPIINRIFSEVAKGKPIMAVCKDLNEEKIPSPQGKQWRRHNIMRMLESNVYQGKIRNSKERLIDCTNLQQIVPLDVAKKAYKIRKANKTGKNWECKNEYLLTGILYCGNCGRKMYANTMSAGDAFKYYHCRSTAEAGKAQRKVCQKSTIRQQDTDLFFRVFSIAGVLRDYAKLKESSKAKELLAGYKEELAELLKQEEQLFDMGLDVEQFNRLAKTLSKKIKILDNKINDIENLPDNVLVDITNTDLAVIAMGAGQHQQLKQLVKEVITRIDVYAEKVTATFVDGQKFDFPRVKYGVGRFLPSWVLHVSEEKTQASISIHWKEDKKLFSVAGVDVKGMDKPDPKMLKKKMWAESYTKILNCFKIDSVVSRKQLFEATKLSKGGICKAIKKLVDANVIVRVGFGAYKLGSTDLPKTRKKKISTTDLTPPCYGHWSKKADECKKCLAMPKCKDATK